MKIKDFDEKVRIGSQISFNGMVYAVVDIDRRTHEAIVGKAAIRIRCSEFELYTGGEVPCYVEEKDPPFKLGRPGKPVVAIFQNGKRKVSPLFQKRPTSWEYPVTRSIKLFTAKTRKSLESILNGEELDRLKIAFYGKVESILRLG